MTRTRNKGSKNLQAVLLENKGRNVKVGADNGISFIYCDILPDGAEIIKIFEKLDAEYLKRLKDIQQKDIATLKSMEATIGNRKKMQAKDIYKKLVDDAISIVPDIDKIDINELMAKIDDYYDQYRKHHTNRLMKKIRKQNEQITHWIPLLQREVTIIRKSVKNDETILMNNPKNLRAIIIEYAGEEKGPYWDRYEYINGVQEDEEDTDDTE